MELNQKIYEEKELKAGNGLLAVVLNLIAMVATMAVGIYASVYMGTHGVVSALPIIACVIGYGYWCFPCWLIFCGIKVIKPNEALVLTLFGKYIGTLKKEGIYYVNPFCVAVNPASHMRVEAETERKQKDAVQVNLPTSKKLSLKTMTLNNEKQKINDELGNPIIIGIAVIWRIANTAKAVFNVDNYIEFLSIQADAALRNVVRLYPYDVAEGGDEKSLRASSQEIANMIKDEIQMRVQGAGLQIEEARITNLAYAPEIAAAMLQRQQASAIIDARKMIVEGAVGMVQMALEKLSEDNVCELDDERRAQMVSNLMVVLCGNKEAQPIVNSGSIY